MKSGLEIYCPVILNNPGQCNNSHGAESLSDISHMPGVAGGQEHNG